MVRLIQQSQATDRLVAEPFDPIRTPLPVLIHPHAKLDKGPLGELFANPTTDLT